MARGEPVSFELTYETANAFTLFSPNSLQQPIGIKDILKCQFLTLTIYYTSKTTTNLIYGSYG